MIEAVKRKGKWRTADHIDEDIEEAMKVWLKMSSRRLKGSRSDDQQSAQTASSVDSEGSVEVEDESADIESA